MHPTDIDTSDFEFGCLFGHSKEEITGIITVKNYELALI